MKKTSFILLLATIVAISCSKSDDPAPGPATSAYMTTTSGATWTYNQSDSTTVPPSLSTYTLVSSNRDTTVSGRSYHVYTRSDGQSEYYNISGNDYYTYQTLPDALGGAQIELKYLNTSLAVNATWTETKSVSFSGFPVTLTFNNKIAEKGITKVINGVSYSNVIHVETTISINPFPLAPPTASEFSSDIDYYYAPKYGMIQSDIKIDIDYMGFVSQTRLHTKINSTNF